VTAIPWIEASWPAPGCVVAGCTTREGGVSGGAYASLNLGNHVGDDPAAVAENRRRFRSSLQLSAEPAWLCQVHGNHVAIDPALGSEADSAITSRVQVACVVMVADCLPVLFCSKDGGQVAAAHAGWRGLAAGVLENTVDAFDARPASLLAWLGPAISQSSFEVGDEVRAAFVASAPEADVHFTRNERGRWQADLYGLARQRLAAIGVRDVFGGEFCTFRDSQRFFSHRRDGTSGRVAGFIFRR